jgi:Ca-activated chloride channel family protein
VVVAVVVATLVASPGLRSQSQEGATFKSGIDLVNVTATVTRGDGRFVDSLHQEDFSIFEDDVLQPVSLFSAGQVPVSLGIVLDASGSMTTEKMVSARAAINRLADHLLRREAEIFFMRFSSTPVLMQEWTTDGQAISRAVDRVDPIGGTALYDAVARALTIAETGRNRKRAVLVISDGNDTNSDISPYRLRSLIRESDVVVYALGVDGNSRFDIRQQRRPVFIPPGGGGPGSFPIPGTGGGRPRFPPIVIGPGGPTGPTRPSPGERVNPDALREITDDTGGRTEIVKGFDNLDGATSRLADELTKQYLLGYASNAPKDGKWHAIRVEVRDRKLQVRARRGFVAS